MAKLLYRITGVFGRYLRVYDTKCVIITEKSIGSLMAGNVTDGEKTIFLKDVVGVQFKKSGTLNGFLQFETPSMQMNNGQSNMFSENTFTFEHGKFGVTNEMMEEVYNHVVDLIEEFKYGSFYGGNRVSAVAMPRFAAPCKDAVTSSAQQMNSVSPAGGTWNCKHCGTSNSTNYSQCKKCGKYKSQ